MAVRLATDLPIAALADVATALTCELSLTAMRQYGAFLVMADYGDPATEFYAIATSITANETLSWWMGDPSEHRDRVHSATILTRGLVAYPWLVRLTPNLDPVLPSNPSTEVVQIVNEAHEVLYALRYHSLRAGSRTHLSRPSPRQRTRRNDVAVTVHNRPRPVTPVFPPELLEKLATANLLSDWDLVEIVSTSIRKLRIATQNSPMPDEEIVGPVVYAVMEAAMRVLYLPLDVVMFIRDTNWIRNFPRRELGALRENTFAEVLAEPEPYRPEVVRPRRLLDVTDW